MTVSLHADKVSQEDELVMDTTVQEANIKFPTDTRLHIDCIEKLWKLGDEVGIKWRRRYTRTVPQLLGTLRTRSNRLVKQRRAARRKIKTIAVRLLKDFERNVSIEESLAYSSILEVIKQILIQGRYDKNKVYSLHDASVQCIGKGKAHKKYEFGRKASVGILRDSCVIVSAKSFESNVYYGDTLEEALWQAVRVCGKSFDNVLVDKGYRGRKWVNQTSIEVPKKARKTDSYYKKKKHRKRTARRAAIEPVIGHLKSDYRLAKCYLRGVIGAGINLLMAAGAWNLKKWINDLLCCVKTLLESIIIRMALYSWGKNQSILGQI